MRTVLAAAIVAFLPGSALAGATLRIDDQRSITIAVGVRSALSSAEKGAPDARSPSYDPLLEGAILALSGELTKQLRVQFNGGRGPVGEIRVIDAILQLEPTEPLRVWAGRVLPPSDRATFTGPYFGTSWDPPFVAIWPSAFAGRDDGAVAWGQIAGGHLKWHAGAFRGRDGGTNAHDDPLYAGRIALSLWEPEPGYYAAGTYHGTRNVLVLGAGGRYQRNGAGIAPNPAVTPPIAGEAGNFRGVTADVFLERRLGAAGAATLEAAVYRYDLDDVADPFLVQGEGFYVTGAWLLPFTAGSARFQPSARWQALEPDGGVRRTRWDGTLNVLLNGHFAKVGVAVSGEDRGDGTLHAVKLGAQIIL